MTSKPTIYDLLDSIAESLRSLVPPRRLVFTILLACSPMLIVGNPLLNPTLWLDAWCGFGAAAGALSICIAIVVLRILWEDWKDWPYR